MMKHYNKSTAYYNFLRDFERLYERKVKHGRPAKTQIRLQSDQNLHRGTFWMASDAKFLHADNEDSDQTARTFQEVRFFNVAA